MNWGDHDFRRRIAIGVIVIAAAWILIVTATLVALQVSGCWRAGGTVVRGLVGFACVDAVAVP